MFSFMTCVVNYVLNPSSKKYYFGHVGGVDNEVQFRFWQEFPVCVSSSNRERRDKISASNSTMLKEIMIDASFDRKN